VSYQYHDGLQRPLIHVCRFRWVFCQFDFLRHCLPGDVQNALAELPETLDATYERTLRGINKATWEFAHRLLQCVTVSSRPLRVEEPAEFLAFDFKKGLIPKFHEDSRQKDPVQAVLSTCPSLLTMVNVSGSQVIEFSHSSVKEYLTSTRLAEASDPISRRYHISMPHAHALVAQACLGILLHMDETITRDSLQNFPLAEYAAEHWVNHVQFEDVLQNAEAGMKQLFDPKKSHLKVWLWIHDPKTPIWNRGERRESPSQPSGTPLHYAALCGLDTIVEFLITERQQDVKSLGFEDRSTPLHAAASSSYRRGAEVARVLLKYGADMKAQDKDGRTPLHAAASRSSSSQGLEVVQALLEKGADAKARDQDGRTPLHVAAGSWSSQRLEVVQALLKKGANAKDQDKHGRTALHEVAVSPSSQGAEVVGVLLEQGSDAMAKDKDGRTPLHAAAGFWSSQSSEVVQALLEKGADAKVQDKHGRTPLHEAAGSSSSRGMAIVDALLEKGADAGPVIKMGSPHCMRRRGPRPHKAWRS
jgi:ankyrin repeat protein